MFRLRQVDVKAEHFERQVTRLEQERDAWEKKYEVRLDS
jgi:tropomyosin